jgi:hypothetical protein
MQALVEQPFWLDPGDPHRIATAMQFLSRPHGYQYAAVSGNWRHTEVYHEQVWATASASRRCRRLSTAVSAM